jgi:hypothetical protein
MQFGKEQITVISKLINRQKTIVSLTPPTKDYFEKS